MLLAHFSSFCPNRSLCTAIPHSAGCLPCYLSPNDGHTRRHWYPCTDGGPPRDEKRAGGHKPRAQGLCSRHLVWASYVFTGQTKGRSPRLLSWSPTLLTCSWVHQQNAVNLLRVWLTPVTRGWGEVGTETHQWNTVSGKKEPLCHWRYHTSKILHDGGVEKGHGDWPSPPASSTALSSVLSIHCVWRLPSKPQTGGCAHWWLWPSGTDFKYAGLVPNLKINDVIPASASIKRKIMWSYQ